MGVSSEVYFMVGVDINDRTSDELIEKLEDDGLIKYKTQSGQLHCLLDGMNGQYTIIGEVVAVGDEYEGICLTSFSVEEFNFVSQRVKYHLSEKYNIEDDPKVYIVTHFH